MHPSFHLYLIITILQKSKDKQHLFYNTIQRIKMAKSKSKHSLMTKFVAKASKSFHNVTRGRKLMLLTNEVHMLRNNKTTQQWTFTRRESEDYRKFKKGIFNYRKTRALYWYCYMTASSRVLFEKWLYGKLEGKSPNDEHSVQLEKDDSDLSGNTMRIIKWNRM